MTRFTASSTWLLVLIFIHLPSYQAHYSPCPPGWTNWRQSCYIELPDKMNWFQASEACNRPGISSLVVPNSQEENTFIWNSFVNKSGGLWIGCTDAAEESVWLCGGQPANYTDWDSSDSRLEKNIHHNCARMTTHKAEGSWADNVPCNKTKWAACEMSASTVPAYHTFTGPDGRVSKRCLLHHGINNLTTDGLLACGWACRADPQCRSFNLWQISKREKECQLNNVTRFGAACNDFKEVNNCSYFDL